MRRLGRTSLSALVAVSLLGGAAATAPAQSEPPVQPTAVVDPRAATWEEIARLGGAAALLPPECMPADPTLLLRMTALESPAERRDGASLEVVAGLPGDDTLAGAVAGDGGGAVAASLAFLSAAYPTLRVLQWSGAAGCDPAIAAAAAAWGATTREQWARVRDGIDALFATATVPARYARRAAVSWYLDTRPTPIAHVALLGAAEWAGAAGADVELAALDALAAGARGDAAAMSDLARRIPDGPDPYLLWVRAEAARQSGEVMTALVLAGRALEADPYFFAAYLTRSSTLIAASRDEEALADLEFLERAFAGVPAYAPWLDRLARRLR